VDEVDDSAGAFPLTSYFFIPLHIFLSHVSMSANQSLPRNYHCQRNGLLIE
jgi:hypothetical protein